MFPLCRSCVQTLQVDICSHSEEERCLFGVWMSDELKMAVRFGYIVKQIYCVHHFARKK